MTGGPSTPSLLTQGCEFHLKDERVRGERVAHGDAEVLGGRHEGQLRPALSRSSKLETLNLQTTSLH